MMTANSSVPCKPTARGRTRMLTVATAVAIALGAGFGTSTSHAATGSVYFDANNNTAAGETLFNGTFTGFENVGLGRSVMPNLTSGDLQRRRRLRRPVRQHQRQLQRRPRRQCPDLERPAATTWPPAAALWQHQR